MTRNTYIHNGSNLEKVILLLIWICIGFVIIYVYFSLFWVITNKEILSRLENITCDLPYGLQEKLEKTYENITSATCEITK